MRRSSREQEEGSILVLTALMLTMLLGITALAVDASYFFDYRNRIGAAADAAAHAAAFEIMRNPSLTSAQLTYFARHQAALPAHGFVDGVGGTTVAVHNPPLSGPYSGDIKFVEVVISRPVSSFFLRVLGTSAMTVGNRAVAGPGDSLSSMVILHPTAPQALGLSIGTQLTVAGNITVDSISAAALDAGGGMVTAGVGGIEVSGNYANCGCSPTPQTGVPLTRDPLEGQPPPSSGGLMTFAGGTYTNAGDVTINSGIYTGNIEITGLTNATFSPGPYILQGSNLTIKSGGNATGSGVTFYMTSGAGGIFGSVTIADPPLTPGITSTAALSAPTGGTNEGILFFQDRSNTQPFTVSGGAIVNLTGVVYAKAARFSFAGGSGSGSLAVYTAFVVNLFTQTGGDLIVGNDYSGLSHGNPLKRAALAE
jgi:hypothetical protein